MWGRKYNERRKQALKEKWGDLYCDGTGFPKDSSLNDEELTVWQIFKLKLRIGWKEKKNKN